jgi:hypothetical protein
MQKTAELSGELKGTREATGQDKVVLVAELNKLRNDLKEKSLAYGEIELVSKLRDGC